MKYRIIKAIIISAGAWSLLQVGHEIIGHGLTVLMVEGVPLSVDAMYFAHDLSRVSAADVRWVRAGGSIFNVLLASLALVILGTAKKAKSYWVNYFLWVTVVTNFLHAGAYIAFGRFIHPGMDWVAILDGVDNRAMWEFLETIGGLGLITIGVITGLKFGSAFAHSDTRKASRFLFWIPLFTATSTSVMASIIMPSTDRWMMVMGGIGNGFIFLFPLFAMGFIKLSMTVDDVRLEKRDAPWLLLFCVALTVFYLLIMSPGITF